MPHDGADCTLSQFADDTKQGGVADMPEDSADIKRDFNRLEKWADMKLMMFHKGTCCSAPGEKQPYAPVYTGGLLPGKLGRKGPGGPVGYQIEQKPTMNLCNKGD